MSSHSITIVGIDKVNLTPANCKKMGIIKKKRSVIFKELDKIQLFLMKKYHSAYVSNAIYDTMITRCIFRRTDEHDYIFKDKYNKMITMYKSGKIHSPYDFELNEFYPILHAMLNGEISEC